MHVEYTTDCCKALKLKIGGTVTQSGEKFTLKASQESRASKAISSLSMTSPPTYYEATQEKQEIEDNFVSVPDCQYHESLLHTFHQLRISDPEVEKVYLARAEARYFRWMDHVQLYGPSMDLLPPIGKLSMLYVSHVFDEY
jgi:hypothetical protein